VSEIAAEIRAAGAAAETGTETGTGADAGPRHAPGRPPMVTTAGITTLGHLAWLAWVWLAFGVVVLGATAAYGVFGEGTVQDSLWQNLGAGWQRWVVLAAGFATTHTFAPMLIGNGVTRAQMSSSVLVTMVVLGLLGGLYITVGFLIEGALFGANDWTHHLDGGRELGTTAIAGLGLRYALVLAVSFAAGWLMGIGFYRFGTEGGLPLIVPCALPIVAVELLLLDGTGGLGIWAMQDWSGPPLAVGAVASVAVIALAGLVGVRYNRELPLQTC
jgi:hypothetical protein